MRFRLPRRICTTFHAKITLILLLAFSAIEVTLVLIAHSRETEWKPQAPKAKEKIFIASIHWNNERVLREHWITAVMQLTEHFGPDNVFVSLQESGSWDDSKGALRSLDQMLEAQGVHRQVILDDTTHKDEISQTPGPDGWIFTSRQRMELRRVPYLARLRNIVMEPLAELAKHGEHFDKILFLNDVVFTTQDVQRLLDTRGGDYAAACALDFSKPPAFYDTFALRDSEGHDALMSTWPYFRARESRHAVKRNEPVPVASCWNGMTVMDAEPFYSSTQPLRFRGIPDSLAKLHLEGSECCLVHTDNYLTSLKGVWLNPSVRVGYQSEAYTLVHPTESWISLGDAFMGLWKNRLYRWFTTPWFRDSIVWKRLRAWRARSQTNTETGGICLINEMQILVENGWAHV